MVVWHEDADDVLQNAFVKAWLSLDSFRGESGLYTWLYRITVNECLSFIAASRTRESTTHGADDDTGSGMAESMARLQADPYFNGDELLARLHAAVMHLPEKQQTVFRLKYFEEMKYEEISELLGTSVGALKASYHIAVKKIEQEISSDN